MKKNYCSPGFLLFVLISVITIILFDPVKGSSTNKGFLDLENLTLKKISRTPLVTQTSGIYSTDFVKLKLNDKKPSLLSNRSDVRFGLKTDKRLMKNSFSLSEKKNNLLTSSSSYGNKLPYTPFSVYMKDHNPWDSERRFWSAAADIVLLEFIPFAISRWLKDWEGLSERNWTKISFKSVWHNLSHGWFYDGDQFLTNFFAHPYHGNLFFNAGRTNGYTFWESIGFAAVGSAVWEHFMETWEPAFNDWVLTTINGVNLGEIMYRVSTLVTDNEARGSERMWLEIAGGLLNPVRGFNRLLSGETHKHFKNPSWRKPDKLDLTLNAGVRVLDRATGENFAKNSTADGLFEFNFLYANDGAKNMKVPFSTFRINFQIATDTPRIAHLHGDGNLWGMLLKSSKRVKQKIVASLNYDYNNNPGFLFGSASFGGDYIRQMEISKKYDVVASGGLRLIPMGATPNDYFAGPEGRNYDFGPGIGMNLRGALKKGRWELISLLYSSGWIWTQSEPTGSKHHLHFATLNLEYPMKDYFALGLNLGAYWRNSYYDYADEVHFKTPIVRFYFKTLIF